jgi:hypothetical protein
MKEVLTIEIAYKQLQKLFDRRPLIIFGTGTSCAIDTGFGMNALRMHLENKLDTKVGKYIGC